MMQQTPAARGMDVNAVMQRLRRLLMLDTTVFDEVRGDTAATLPAVAVAVISTFLFGLGGWLWFIFQDYDSGSGDVFLRSVIVGSIVSLILWAVWVGVTYVMLTQMFRARADVNEIVRVMGFAAAPLALGVLMFIPGLDFGISVAAVGLLLGANLIAVQSATDAPAGKVLASVGAGFAVWALVLSLLASEPQLNDLLVPNFFIFAPASS